MRQYQLVLLLKSNLKKDDKEKLFADIKKWIGAPKSEKIDSLGERKLAYSIKGERAGEYLVFNFETETVNTDLVKRLQMREDIIRHLLIKQ